MEKIFTLQSILKILKEKILSSILVVTIFFVLGIGFALWQKNIYKSEALVMKLNSDSSSNFPSNASTLMNLAGFDTSSAGKQSNFDIAIQLIQSRSYVKDFIEKNDLLEYFVSNEDIDDKSKAGKYYEIAFKNYINDNLRITKLPNPNFLKISFQHNDPQFSYKLINLILTDVDDYLRGYEQQNIDRSIEFLNKRIELNKLQPLDEVLTSILYEQTRESMMISSNKDYAFRILDKPSIPLFKISPNRTAMVIGFTIIGLLISFIRVLLIYSIREF